MSLVRDGEASASFTRLRSSVVLRLLAGVMLFSSVVTLLLTLFQIYRDYDRGVGVIESRLDDVGKSYLGSLGEGLWRLDRQQLQLQVQGILRLSDIRTVEIREISDRHTPMVVTAGRRGDHSVIAREFPIAYRIQGVERPIGVLYVEATLAELYHHLMDTAVVILISQGLKTFLVSSFIIYIFHHLVTRHLVALATFVGGFDLNRPPPPPPFRLPRRPPARPDELDRVVAALNASYANLWRAYDSLREREARIRRLVDANIIGIVFWDVRGNISEANDAFLRMVGYSRQDLVSGEVRWWDMTPPEHRAISERALAEIMATGSCQPFEKEYVRKDGSRVPVLVGSARFERIKNEGVAFVLDLSERKEAEKRQDLLLQELDHRVKNTLATVLAISRQTLRTAESPAAFGEAFQARLLTLSQTHNLLNQNGWQGVSLRDVLEQDFTPHVSGDRRRFMLTGKDITLGPIAAVTLGMAFHELATNAAKYGALSVPSGRVQVAWAVGHDHRLHLDWRETGGPPVQPPRRRGFGSRLIERGLPGELAGEVHLDFPPEGLHCTMEMSLERVSLH